MQDSLVVEEGMLIQFPLVPFATCLLPLQKKLNNHIVEIHRRGAHLLAPRSAGVESGFVRNFML